MFSQIGRYGFSGNSKGIPTDKLINYAHTTTSKIEMFSNEFHTLLNKGMKEEAFDFLISYEFSELREMQLITKYFPEICDQKI